MTFLLVIGYASNKHSQKAITTHLFCHILIIHANTQWFNLYILSQEHLPSFTPIFPNQVRQHLNPYYSTRCLTNFNFWTIRAALTHYIINCEILESLRKICIWPKIFSNILYTKKFLVLGNDYLPHDAFNGLWKLLLRLVLETAKIQSRTYNYFFLLETIWTISLHFLLFSFCWSRVSSLIVATTCSMLWKHGQSYAYSWTNSIGIFAYKSS